MSKSAELLVKEAIEKTGWNEDSTISVLLEYIENQGSNAAFADFLAEKVEAETDPFAGQFMQPYVQHGEYFEVETTHGTEIVPADVVGRTTETVHVEFLLNYLEGKPTNEDEELPRKTGWLARMSAPGYMDCTSWEAHPTEEAARQALIDQYGNDA